MGRASFASVKEEEKIKREERLNVQKRRNKKAGIREHNWTRENSRGPLLDMRMEMYQQQLEKSKSSMHRNPLSVLSKKDSKEFNNVKNSLKTVIAFTKGQFTNKPTENEKMLRDAAKAYSKLLEACEIYLAKSGGKHSAGKERKDNVKFIHELAQEDYAGIHQKYHEMKKMPAEQQGKLDWQDILFSGREISLEVGNLEDKDYFKKLGSGSKGGDGASYLMKGTGVFTKESKTQNYDGISGNVTGIAAAFASKGKSNIFLGNEINVTNRNVATSRMAALLGLSGIVAESKNVKVHDRTTNSTYRGNMMEFAEGKEAYDVGMEFAEKNKVNKIKNLEERGKIAAGKITPGVQKELCALQILDYICGQGDRSQANYFLQKNAEEQLIGVKAIDNDMSFGSGVDLKEGKGAGYLGGIMEEGADGKLEITMPYMDQQLAKNIINLKEEEVIFALEDLISPGMIELTLRRLRKTKEAVVNSQKNNPEIFVENWDDERANERAMEMFENSHIMLYENDKKRNQEKNVSDWKYRKKDTYFGQLMARMAGYKGRNGGENVFGYSFEYED